MSKVLAKLDEEHEQQNIDQTQKSKLTLRKKKLDAILGDYLGNMHGEVEFGEGDIVFIDGESTLSEMADDASLNTQSIILRTYVNEYDKEPMALIAQVDSYNDAEFYNVPLACLTLFDEEKHGKKL